MFNNYFKIATRNLKKNRLFSLINVAGLAIGISACLVIYLIVQYEFSFDKFQRDGDRIYRVVTHIEFTDMNIENSGVPAPTADAARMEIPGFEVVTQFFRNYEQKVSVPIERSAPVEIKRQADIIYADENYFKLIDYEWLSGSPDNAFNAPLKTVLTESRAKLYFGNTEPSKIIGRTLIYDDTIQTTVSGVVRDIKKSTDFAFKEFVSLQTVTSNAGLKEQNNWGDWGSSNGNSQMLVKLRRGVNPAQITKQLNQLRDRHREKNKENPKKDDTQHFLQPLSDIHFSPVYDAFEQRQAHKPTLYGLLAVSLFLLLLGCINFINLTTAQSSQRAREIGIRKTMGSSKRQLVAQFLSETLLLAISATLLSILITPWLLKMFKDFIPPAISFTSLNQPHVWIFLVALIIVVTLLAGFYPALVLTRFKPVTVLKNQAYANTSQTRKAWLRKTLTVTQFIIAQFLIIATVVVSKQIHYSINKDLGYKTDAIVSFNTRWNFFSTAKDDRRFELQQKLKTIPGIARLSLAGSAPASTNTSTTSITFREEGKKMVETMVEVKIADTNYFDLFKLRLLSGRNLLPSDTAKEYIINETYAKMLGFKNPADAVGHMIERDSKLPIVGVISDFHTKSTHVSIKPLLYANAANQSFSFHMALDPQHPGKWKETIASVQKAYKSIYPDDDFNYRFYDDSIASFYKTEQNVSRLLSWSAGLCILISCLGLLGLVVYITNTRTKEIGVRKVLGASVVQIVSLLSKDFLLLVLVAFVITVPLAWWVMNNWLQDFAYRTDLSWWIFAATGTGMVLVALLILSARTVKSAMGNPVKSLRTE